MNNMLHLDSLASKNSKFPLRAAIERKKPVAGSQSPLVNRIAGAKKSNWPVENAIERRSPSECVCCVRIEF